MLSKTLKAAAAVAVLSFAASQWAYSQADRIALAKLTAETAGRFDPLTTGSTAQSAQSYRIDPCNVPSR